MSVDFVPLVYVVIPCHNDYEHTRKTIANVILSDYPNLKLILVDDGSTDNTDSKIKEEFPKVTILLGDGTLWWAGAMNKGIKYAMNNNMDFIFVLNNDVIVSKDTISQLVLSYKKCPNSIIGSLIYDLNNPEVIWSAGGILKWPWPGEIQLGMGEIDSGQFEGLTKRDWNPGMGTLISRHIIENTGYYSEKQMPQYLADSDFCLRAKKKGFPLFIASKSKIYNNIENTGGIVKKGRLTVKEVKFIFTNLRSSDHLRSRIIFIWRHSPWYLFLPAIFIRYIRLIIYIIKS